MKTWTDEAKAYTNRYLRQVQVLLEGGGADAKEVIEDLQRHIHEQAKNSPQVVITIDEGKRILADLGSPEDVALSWRQMGTEPEKKTSQDAATPSPPASTASKNLRWVVLLIGIVGVIIAIPVILVAGVLAMFVARQSVPGDSSVSVSVQEHTIDIESPLFSAAANGHLAEVTDLLEHGADPNAVDANGMTPLHHAGKNGHSLTAQCLVDHGANPAIRDNAGKTPADYAAEGGHEATRAAIESNPVETPPPVTEPDSGSNRPDKPTLKYPTLESYSATIGESGSVHTNENLMLYAPSRYDSDAKVIFDYLSNAYDALYGIVGQHTKYRIVVYHFPEGHPDATGGTSECVIRYGYENLNLASSEEWTAHGVPHVSGYIEEMAHNFVDATHAQFGWEMTGWSIGIIATKQVADNPTFERALAGTRQRQAETYARYVDGGFVFPPDIEANLVDRIHAHILGLCEQQYGARFWPDFFSEIRKEKSALDAAVSLSGNNAVRNERYRITVDCFDRLPGLNFTHLLNQAQISTTVDIKSLNPTDPNWNRQLR